MTIDEFKMKLRAGEVKFAYTKGDGTGPARPARGTLCEALIPKSEPIAAKFRCTNIVWDLEGAEDLKRKPRRNCVVALTQRELDAFEDEDEAVCEALTNKFKLCVKEFEYCKIESCDESEREVPDSNVFYYDLDKGGFRSFKFSNLIQDKESK